MPWSTNNTPLVQSGNFMTLLSLEICTTRISLFLPCVSCRTACHLSSLRTLTGLCQRFARFLANPIFSLGLGKNTLKSPVYFMADHSFGTCMYPSFTWSCWFSYTYSLSLIITLNIIPPPSGSWISRSKIHHWKHSFKSGPGVTTMEPREGIYFWNRSCSVFTAYVKCSAYSYISFWPTSNTSILIELVTVFTILYAAHSPQVGRP